MNPVILRAVEKTDTPILDELAKDPEVKKYIGGLGALSGVERRIIERPGDGAVGVVSVGKSLAMDGQYSELVCAILPKFRNGGLAVGACRKMLALTLDDQPLTEVIACVNRNNRASVALTKRLGGTFLKRRDSLRDDEDIWVFRRVPTLPVRASRLSSGPSA